MRNVLCSLAFLCVAFVGLSECQYVTHLTYKVKYDSDTKNPRWVSWVLSSNMIYGVSTRRSIFTKDPNLTCEQASHYDYTGSGYDRGHMCPAADNRFNKEAMKESFYVSNICLQVPQLNRGIWKFLETECRNRCLEGPLVIIAGPIYDSNTTNYIGSAVRVPDKFFKVIYDGELEYSYIYSNMTTNLYELNVSIDDIEESTGLDLFSRLDFDESVTNSFWR